jgi:hypothetical protein
MKHWITKVELNDETPNLSGEKQVYCPDCNTKASCSSAWVDKDGNDWNHPPILSIDEMNQLEKQANDLKQSGMNLANMKVIELVLKGFKGDTDKTDDRIIWIAIPKYSYIHLNDNKSNVIESFNEIKWDANDVGIDILFY